MRMNTRFFVPARITVTRTGDRYHFNEECQFTRQARNNLGTRILTPCQICTHQTRRQGIFVVGGGMLTPEADAPDRGQPAIEYAD